ncbi:50S ribosomal protein L4 [bacterium]|nr:50S ribosomal protein L4 [bacterium]
MPVVTIKNQQGGDAGTVDLASGVFAAEQNAVLVREVYNAYMQNQRQGTHKTKTRGLVSGGGKKPWKQKHTGRARQGSIRAPQWRHGAIIFGPVPRDYREKINSKKKQGAFRALLSAKLERGEVIVVDAISLDAPKTKSVVAFRAAVGAKGKTLIVTAEKNENLVRATANLGSSAATPTRVGVVNAVSIFDLLTCDTLVVTKDALNSLQERLS